MKRNWQSPAGAPQRQDPEEVGKRRRRTLQSCFNCHARKQRCDRSRPCRNCVSRHVEGSCQYMADEAPPSLQVDRPALITANGPLPSAPQSPKEIQSYIKACLGQLPTRRSCLFLVNSYFSSPWYVCPESERERFVSKMEHLWLSQHLPFLGISAASPDASSVQLDWPWLQLLTAILGVTLQTLPRAALPEVYHPTHNIHDLAANAYNLSIVVFNICQSLKIHHNEDTLAALAMCSSWQKNTGRAYLAREHTAEAIALAVEMRYHINSRPEDPRDADWYAIDRREQLWELLYQMDRNLSFVLDRPRATLRLRISTKPCRNVFAAGGIEQPESVLTPSTHSFVGRRFGRILDMVDETKKAIRLLSNWEQKIRLLHPLNAALEHFEATLPPEFSLYGPETDPELMATVTGKDFVAKGRYLTLVYLYEVVIQVNRPVIANFGDFPEHQKEADVLVQRCCEAAQKLARLQLASVDATFGGHKWLSLGSFVNVFFIYDAAITLLLAISTIPSDQNVPRWCSAVDDIDRVLFQLAQDHNSAAPCRPVIHLFKTTARRALARAGRIWEGDNSLQDVLDVQPADTEELLMSTDGGVIKQDIPLFHLGIRLSWGIDLDAAMSNGSPSAYSDASALGSRALQEDIVSAPSNQESFDFGIDFTPLDLLQADYLTQWTEINDQTDLQSRTFTDNSGE